MLKIAQLRSSIAGQLLTAIFGCYLIFTIIVTTVQMVVEYQHVQVEISQEIQMLPNTFGPGIGTALWTYNYNLLDSILAGMQEITTVSGVRIDDQTNIRGIGLVEDEQGNYLRFEAIDQARPVAEKPGILSNLLSHEFEIVYMNPTGQPIHVGTGVIYTSTAVILDRVKYGFVLIIISSLLKTLALWFIFLFFVQRMLGVPLSQLTVSLQKVHLDNLEKVEWDIHIPRENELKKLKDSFKTMLHKLLEGRQKLDAINQNLDQIVAQRTQEIREINQHLEQEIQAREQVEIDLKHSVSLLLATLEASTDGILVVDSSETVVEMNQKFAEIWKLPSELIEHREKSPIVSWISSQLKAYDSFLLRLQESHNEIVSEHFKALEFKDGRFCEIYAFPQRLGDRVVGRVWRFRDITDKHKMEQRMAQTQKLESLGTLAGGVAHDFNNILAAVLMNIELVIMNLDEDNPAYALAQNIASSAERAADLVHQIQAFSRMEVLALEPTKLHIVVKSALKMIRATIPAHIQIQKHIPEECSLILANTTQIHQVVINLCTNAFHAVEATEGHIEVRLEELPGVPAHLDFDSKTCVMLTVTDNGYGIAAEDQEKIFDPFFTTKEVGKGTGLGLSVVHGIVKNHGGVIEVESQVNRGTSITIFFPTTEQTKKPVTVSKPLPRTTQSTHILLVDDEPEILEPCCFFLEKQGFTVTSCSNGEEALAKFQQNPNAYDLLLSDVNMPHMTGKKLAEAVTALNPNLPVILFTGHTEDLNEEQAKALGVRKFLTKPLLLAELQVAIQECLVKS